MKKKISIISFILIFAVSLSACGSKDIPKKDKNVKKNQKEDTFDSSTFDINGVDDSKQSNTESKIEDRVEAVFRDVEYIEKNVNHNAEDLKKASYDKISVINDASISRINKNFERYFQKSIQNPKVIRELYKVKIEEQAKDYQNKKSKLEKIWNEYDKKIEKAKEGRENAKKSLESKLAKETKENMNIDTSEVEKYILNIQAIAKWRNDELAKMK